MRKFLLGALLPVIMLSSCGSDEEPKLQDGEGVLVIKTQIVADDVQVSSTRAETPDLYVTLTNRANNNVFIEKTKLSSDGKIENIPVGNYDVLLTTHPNGFSPAFDTPCYEGIKANIGVSKDSSQEVQIECTQKNAGIRFIYDNSILQNEEYKHMYPVINQDNEALEYKGNQKEKTGYFNTGKITINFTDANGVYYIINKKKEIELTLQSKQLVEVTLKTENISNNNNSIKMVVTIKAVNQPTEKIDFSLDKSEEIFSYEQANTPGGFRLNLKSTVLLDDMRIFYCLKSAWNENEEMTKQRIIQSGRKIVATELQEVNSPTGKWMSFENLKANTDYIMWIFGEKNGNYKIKKAPFRPQEAEAM